MNPTSETNPKADASISMEEMLASSFGWDRQTAFDAALEMIAEDLPDWIVEPFEFRFSSQIELYAKRGPHSLHKNREFRKLVSDNEIIRLELFFRAPRTESYRIGASSDIMAYIAHKCDRDTDYYESNGRYYIIVLPTEEEE